MILAWFNFLPLTFVHIIFLETGRLMAKFVIAFETMKNFHKISGKETLDELVSNKLTKLTFIQLVYETVRKFVLLHWAAGLSVKLLAASTLILSTIMSSWNSTILK
jgi:hypothetical protein